MYDSIIIGAGVAGLTAAIYGQRRAMKILVLSKDVGGQVNLTIDIENYPGFDTITAQELIERMSSQVKKLGVKIETTEVKEIKKQEDNTFIIKTDKKEYKTKSIVLAMGLLPRRLDVEGEIEFAGRGVSYCSNCDGPFFKNKKIVVVGGGNSALDAAEYLSKIGSEVHLLHRSEKFRAFEGIVGQVKKTKNITVYTNTEIKKITGDKKVEKVIIVNNKTKEEQEIEVDGIFIEIGRVASTDIVADLVERDKGHQIIINENCATSTVGIFAAGDVTTTPIKQITVACGLGTIAILSAYKHLHHGKKHDLLTEYDR